MDKNLIIFTDDFNKTLLKYIQKVINEFNVLLPAYHADIDKFGNAMNVMILLKIVKSLIDDQSDGDDNNILKLLYFILQKIKKTNEKTFILFIGEMLINNKLYKISWRLDKAIKNSNKNYMIDIGTFTTYLYDTVTGDNIYRDEKMVLTNTITNENSIDIEQTIKNILDIVYEDNYKNSIVYCTNENVINRKYSITIPADINFNLMTNQSRSKSTGNSVIKLLNIISTDILECYTLKNVICNSIEDICIIKYNNSKYETEYSFEIKDTLANLNKNNYYFY